MNSPNQFEVRFLKKQQLAKDAYAFYFQRPSDFEFLPGHFVRITLPIANPDQRGNSRFFSIASSPTEKDHIMIAIRIITSAYKKTLEHLESGIQTKLSGPYGSFILNPQETVQHTFLAGGIGVTPFRSMIRYAVYTNLNVPMTLLVSSRTKQDIVFSKEFHDFAKNHSWFKFVETITRPEESRGKWSGNTGRIDENLIKKNVSDFSRTLFYISGPPIMVDDMAKVVLSLGVDEKRIRKERFTGY